MSPEKRSNDDDEYDNCDDDDDDDDDKWDRALSLWMDGVARDVKEFARKCYNRLADEVWHDCVASVGSRAEQVLQTVSRTLDVQVRSTTGGTSTLTLVKPRGRVVRLSPDAASRVAKNAVKRAFSSKSQGSFEAAQNGTSLILRGRDGGAIDADGTNTDSKSVHDDSGGRGADTGVSDRLDEWGETIDAEMREFVRKCRQHARVEEVEHAFHIWGGMSAQAVVKQVAHVLGCQVVNDGTAARPVFLLRKPAHLSLRASPSRASKAIGEGVVALRSLRRNRSAVDIDAYSISSGSAKDTAAITLDSFVAQPNL